MFNATAVGLILQFTHSYLPVFIVAGSMYLLALLVIHLLAPRLEPANIDGLIEGIPVEQLGGSKQSEK
jgi:ACS family hexuronate transporter-like MFS transporter